MTKLKPLIEYVIKRKDRRFDSFYEITKYKHVGIVDTVYYVAITGSKVSCSCPGFDRQHFPKKFHKHVLMAQDFKKRNLHFAVYGEFDKIGNPNFLRGY